MRFWRVVAASASYWQVLSRACERNWPGSVKKGISVDPRPDPNLATAYSDEKLSILTVQLLHDLLFYLRMGQRNSGSNSTVVELSYGKE